MDFDKKRKNAWISPLKTGLIIFKTEIKIVKFCYKFLFLETEVWSIFAAAGKKNFKFEFE